MDSEEDIKRGVVKLVTASPRRLGRYEEEPRPLESGWVDEQIERKKGIYDPLKKFFPPSSPSAR